MELKQESEHVNTFLKCTDCIKFFASVFLRKAKKEYTASNRVPGSGGGKCHSVTSFSSACNKVQNSKPNKENDQERV